MRQTLQAAPHQQGVASGTATTSTITIEESGRAYLADMILSGHQEAPVANTTENVSDALEITAIQVNGSVVLVRGRNTPASANFLSPTRGPNWVDLPALDLKSGDTIAVTWDFIYAGTTIDVALAVPFAPSRFNGLPSPALPAGQEIAVSCPATAIADDTAVVLTATIENYGVIDLDRTVVQWHLDPTPNVDPVSAMRYELAGSMNAMSVRNDYPLVAGAGTPIAPTAFFAKDRVRNRFRAGKHRVTPGDAVTMTIQADAGAAGDAVFSFPQYITGADGGGLGASGLRGAGNCRTC